MTLKEFEDKFKQAYLKIIKEEIDAGYPSEVHITCWNIEKRLSTLTGIDFNKFNWCTIKYLEVIASTLLETNLPDTHIIDWDNDWTIQKG